MVLSPSNNLWADTIQKQNQQIYQNKQHRHQAQQLQVDRSLLKTDLEVCHLQEELHVALSLEQENCQWCHVRLLFKMKHKIPLRIDSSRVHKRNMLKRWLLKSIRKRSKRFMLIQWKHLLLKRLNESRR